MAMAQACQDLLVDYIGLNFVPSSKRVVSAIQAQKLSHAFTGKKVGVFMDQKIEEILEIISIVDIDIIQLHGSETSEFIDQLRPLIPAKAGISCWKAFGIDQDFDIKDLQQYSTNCDALLFDGKSPGSGAQITHNTKLAEAIKESQRLNIPYVLAGGINPETLPSLISDFPETEIFDSASGVETNGEFDYAKLKKIMTTLKFEL